MSSLCKIRQNFDFNHKKISDDLMPQKSREARTAVRDLVEPDVLGIKSKEWNVSNNPKICNYRDIKKDLFEVTQGLNNCHMVPLKEHIVEEGVDSRNYMFLDGSKWENSVEVNDSALKKLHEETKLKAEKNSTKYWRHTEEDRSNKLPFFLIL